MTDDFPREPTPPRPTPRRPGRVLPFRLPLSGLLSRTLWRWSAAVAVVALGLLLTALSLRPGWFLPDPAPAAAPSGSEGGPVEEREEDAGPIIAWEGVEGATTYRLSFLDPETGTLVLSMSSRETSLLLPSEAAARLAPAATCELVVEALSAEGAVLGRESRLFEPPRDAPSSEGE